MLKIARNKPTDPVRVTFQRYDAFHPIAPSRDFNAGLAAFWWSRISRTRLHEFLQAFNSALMPGPKIIFANRYVEGSSTPTCRADEEGNTDQRRHLNDGSTYEVFKNFPTADELRQTLAPYANDVDVTCLNSLTLPQKAF